VNAVMAISSSAGRFESFATPTQPSSGSRFELASFLKPPPVRQASARRTIWCRRKLAHPFCSPDVFWTALMSVQWPNSQSRRAHDAHERCLILTLV
jgi:hypothetical protein